MGQKTSPIALRKNLNYKIWDLDSNFALHTTIQEYLINFFYKKGILINNISTKKDNEVLYIFFDFIIGRSSKLYTKRFRKNLYKKRRFFKAKKKFFLYNKKRKKKKLKPLFKLLAKLFHVNKILLKAQRLEAKLSPYVVHMLKKKGYPLRLRQQLKSNYLKDFFKVASLLLYSKKINIKLISFLLSKHFAWLPKRQHKRFLTFVRDFFKLLYNFDKDKTMYQRIDGIKLIVNGKIAGKNKSAKFQSSVGSIFTPTLSKNVNYATSISYSKLGIFGWKLWITLTDKPQLKKNNRPRLPQKRKARFKFKRKHQQQYQFKPQSQSQIKKRMNNFYANRTAKTKI